MLALCLWSLNFSIPKAQTNNSSGTNLVCYVSQNRSQVSNLLSIENVILNAEVRLVKVSLMVLLIFFSLEEIL